MKKLTFITAAVFAIMLAAIPAMAVDLELSGSYDASGYYLDRQNLYDDNLFDDEGSSDAWFDMDLRIDPVFKVHDRLSLVTRLHVFEDQVWGQQVPDKTGTDNADFVNWKHAYLKAKFDIGTLSVGRMVGASQGGNGAPYGTEFLDCDGVADRIKFVTKIDPVTVFAVYEKGVEQDTNLGDHNSDLVTGPEDSYTDSDYDKYFAGAVFKAEGIEAGLLLAYATDKSNSDIGAITYDREFYYTAPYVKATLGPVNLEAEISYWMGDSRDYHDSAIDDIDKKALAFYLYGDMNAGPATVGLGCAFSQGDGDDADDEDNFHPGCNEWQPLLILFSDKAGAGLGGNLTALGIDLFQGGNYNSDSAGTIADWGYELIYATATMSPTENVTLNAAIGYCQAEDVPSSIMGIDVDIDDEVGWEFDLGVEVKLMDNLTYHATAAYLLAGDVWEDVHDEYDVLDIYDISKGDTWAVVHGLTLTF